MNDWQPIETAPKDGTRILIESSKKAGEVIIVNWEPSVPYPCFMDDEGESHMDPPLWHALPIVPVRTEG